jgi:hypothetical protein
MTAIPEPVTAADLDRLAEALITVREDYRRYARQAGSPESRESYEARTREIELAVAFLHIHTHGQHGQTLTEQHAKAVAS